MSNDDNTPEDDIDLEGGDVDDLATLEVDPDELPEGEEVDPDAIDGDDAGEAEASTSDATDEVAAVDDERLNLDDDEEVEKPKRKRSEDIDENELSGIDDEEADLATILAEKLRSSDELAPDDEIVVVDADDSTDGTPLLQPRRPDEDHCQQCFLLVRKSAPKCPVDHDLCPKFPVA
ncbi:MAG: hypothetical protein ACO3EV_06510 [Ilumatobacteraceae bacterium]